MRTPNGKRIDHFVYKGYNCIILQLKDVRDKQTSHVNTTDWGVGGCLPSSATPFNNVFQTKSLTLPVSSEAAKPDRATNALDKSKLLVSVQTETNKCRLIKFHIQVVVMKLREDIKVFLKSFLKLFRNKALRQNAEKRDYVTRDRNGVDVESNRSFPIKASSD